MVSLVKNQTVSLSKESSALSQLHFGLGWDPVKKKGLLGGLFGGNDSIDLDAGCVLMDSTGKTIDTIWFRKLESTCGAVENMSFGLKLAGAKKDVINQRVTQVAEVLQLAHLLERKPKALSGGQRQRVAIGRTLVAEPRVFLLDEPLSNLDAALRVQMRIEISRLHKRLGRTMIYVTHDQVEAMTLADKIVVLDAGRVAQVGKPLELYHYPADRFVAGFIGSPKMNFLPVKVTATAIEQVQVELPNRQQVWLPVDSANVQVGANMSLGIRPEHLLPSHIADVTLEGDVQVVEQLGHETQIHIQIPAIRQNLVYRQNDVVLVEEGATFAIGLPPERCHLFREDGTACRRLHKEPGV